MIHSRRQVLAAGAALPLLGNCARAAPGPVTVRVDPSKSLGRIPTDFMGLGYEISSVAVPGLLSAKNNDYVQLLLGLGIQGQGVLRIGGNTSDFSRYDALGTPASAPKATVVTEANLHELRGFLDAIKWKLIWGLNLGDDKLDNAVEEARAVASIMGDKLLALEIGNEPDLFPRAGHRGADYGYPAWLADYRRYKSAIRAVVPHAPFAGPDLAGAADWMEQFARDERDIALLTAHHYITGQANPAATIETMLADNPKYDAVLTRFQAAARAAGKPWRMCETASFSGGGKDGVSNTFAAALWALDYLFVLAEHGCAGVNMETGVNHLGWISHYTPIGDDLKGHYAKAPEYYGLYAFAFMAAGELVAVDCQTGGINLTAHAVYGNRGPRGLDTGKAVRVALINKDLRQDAEVSVTTGRKVTYARPLLLSAPSATATSGIVMDWAPNAREGIKPEKDGAVRVHVPAASATLVWLEI
ncbi:MAG TPA: glycosyl hydrolase family 79 C-terminal domain-containing protein [Rhizomicrobium sp.]|nr:glycosyl hydrolase family 79 C-terminal domain-containing protein [Rhizomicrobium sp.]